MDLARFISETTLRLVVAAVLGGLIGLDRELKQKPAGLRTNMFICFGCAMFTVLSFRFVGDGQDPTRIAANIIPGIGFIGAGSILHSRGSVSGLTTAATIFVVASIGMAVGGGEYLTATFATLVIIAALNLLGWVETRFNLKSSTMGYAISGRDPEKMISAINLVLKDLELQMGSVNLGSGTEGKHRLHFTVTARAKLQEELLHQLQRDQQLDRVEVMRSADGE
ncbi:MAG: MgtC/SapB family protein [Acidobacteriales bacterium]|nr:MgtC/SapB family protein [Terriglobales bacterium]